MRGIMADCQKLREEIIGFVRNSPEEVNSQIAVFIAGMQAQKTLMEGQQKKARDGFAVVKASSDKKRGG
jgi:hypothetical protein